MKKKKWQTWLIDSEYYKVNKDETRRSFLRDGSDLTKTCNSLILFACFGGSSSIEKGGYFAQNIINKGVDLQQNKLWCLTEACLYVGSKPQPA